VQAHVLAEAGVEARADDIVQASIRERACPI
jgi:hypothetical protein